MSCFCRRSSCRRCSSGQSGTGPTGPQGAAGPAGSDGRIGATGAAGSNGINGVAGATGARGATGDAGSDGVDGAAGTAGTTGATGATGGVEDAGGLYTQVDSFTGSLGVYDLDANGVRTSGLRVRGNLDASIDGLQTSAAVYSQTTPTVKVPTVMFTIVSAMVSGLLLRENNAGPNEGFRNGLTGSVDWNIPNGGIVTFMRIGDQETGSWFYPISWNSIADSTRV